MFTPEPQPVELNPSPIPMQAANSAFSKLKPFRYAQTLHPEQLLIGAETYNQLVAPLPWDLLIHKEIL